jgi:rhodanese-related sulfurtransferase
MPTYYRKDAKPVVQFDPTVEISPFALFRRLSENRDVLLVDVRPSEPASGQAAGTPRSLVGAVVWEGDSWSPPEDREIVLFDDDGSEAVAVAGRLIERGFPRVRALFGGLDLYEFSLDPQVVGEATFLVAGSGD